MDNIRNILDWLLTIVIAIIISLFIVSNLFTLTQIKEQSMEPTFKENDRVVVNKIGYFFKEPKRGDIVILNREMESRGLIKNMVYEARDIIANISSSFTGVIKKNNLIKRVVAVEGDLVDIRDGNLYINGELQEEDYIKGLTPAKYNLEYPLEVPQGKVFVLGDNRENSLDSRDFGLVDIHQLKGRVVFRLFPLNRFGRIR
ncbi:MAG: signal peptidase I [Tissierellia bacterium]|nr:signal peptidase I [Tissierellia bacterium]